MIQFNMKKLLCLLCLFTFFALSSTVMTSCSRKTGCPMNEKMGPKTNKQGQLKVPRKRKRARVF